MSSKVRFSGWMRFGWDLWLWPGSSERRRFGHVGDAVRADGQGGMGTGAAAAVRQPIGVGPEMAALGRFYKESSCGAPSTGTSTPGYEVFRSVQPSMPIQAPEKSSLPPS